MGQTNRNQRWPEKHWLTYHRGNTQQAASTYDSAGDLQRALYDIGIPVESVGAGKFTRGDDSWVWGYGIPPVNAVHQPADPLAITTDADLVVQAGPGGTVDIFDAVSSRLVLMRLDPAAADRLCARIVRAAGGDEAAEIATRLDLISAFAGGPITVRSGPKCTHRAGCDVHPEAAGDHDYAALARILGDELLADHLGANDLVRPVPLVGPATRCSLRAGGRVEVFAGEGTPDMSLIWAVNVCDAHRGDYIARSRIDWDAARGYPTTFKPGTDVSGLLCGDVVDYRRLLDKETQC